jgi:hypothetical protein
MLVKQAHLPRKNLHGISGSLDGIRGLRQILRAFALHAVNASKDNGGKEAYYPRPEALGDQRYLGQERRARRARSPFSVAYADHNERDHATLKRAIRDGKVEAVFEAAK